MKKFIFIWIFFAAFAQADTDCLFGPPCPLQPTAAEIEAVDKMFIKARYALGAIYTVKNAKYIDNPPYNNIPEYVRYTAKLKQAVSALSSEAKQLNTQANGYSLHVAVNFMRLCIGSYNDSSQCSLALTQLREFWWDKEFGDSWSGYPVGKKWEGFPDSMK